MNSPDDEPLEALAAAWQDALAGALLTDGLVERVPDARGRSRLELTAAGREAYRFGGLRHPGRQPRNQPPGVIAALCAQQTAEIAGAAVVDLLPAFERDQFAADPPARAAAAFRAGLVRALRLCSLDDFDAPHPRTVGGLPTLQVLDAVDSAGRASASRQPFRAWLREAGLEGWCVPESEWQDRRAGCEPVNDTLPGVARLLDGRRVERARLTRDGAPFPAFDGIRLTLDDGQLLNVQVASTGGALELFATPDASRYSLRRVEGPDALIAALVGRTVRDAWATDDPEEAQVDCLTITLRESDAVEIHAPGCEPYSSRSPVSDRAAIGGS